TKNAIIRINPRKIVYVSCSPPTWARDIRFFSAQGYTLNEITMIDMFPGTKHIEVISKIEKTDL
ncbi:MAG TPA: 23S rRNA (uracil-5-)-methyltransferase RumA, partial [Spirochaetota bacterium]|nr:23S rRNA (uracil-5-)-methyltransferase RumA [Spirochaetota bacterium]